MGYDFEGKTVLITGASGGIGEAFARQLAGRGARLVLVARSEARLRALAEALGQAQVIVADLAAPGAAASVVEAVSSLGLEVDVLINNAGYGLFGRFEDLPLEGQRGEIAVNVSALVELTHLLLPTIERRRGGVLLVASVAAYIPTPYMAVYGATKAFVLSFGEALWAEYRGRGVRVLTLSPGQTDTGFFTRAGEGLKQQELATPDAVARLGLEAFEGEGASVVHGARNAAAVFFSRFLPRETNASLIERMTRPAGEALHG